MAGKGPSGGKGAGAASKTGTVLKDFRVEYSKSGAAACRKCEEKIKKVSIEVSSIKGLSHFCPI